jgi:hypothetical protein
MQSIQELENVNYELYEDKPEDLIPISRKMVDVKKFEKGIEIMEKAILLAIKKNNNDEVNIHCAKFYSNYADALIRKCMENMDILNLPVEEKEKDNDKLDEKNVKEDVLKENNNKICNKSNIEQIIEDQKNKLNEKDEIQVIDHKDHDNTDEIPEEEKEENENDEEKEEKEETDEEVAFENLAFAEKIYKIYLEEYSKVSPKELKEKHKDIVRLYLDLSDVYQKFGDLEMVKSDYPQAVQFFQKALELRELYDDNFSRAIAELYFSMASVYDSDSKKCLLCYYKTKIIMLYHLKNELMKCGSNTLSDKIIFEGSDLLLTEVSTQKAEANNSNNDLDSILSNNENFSDNVVELIAIVREINDKVN